MDTFQNFFKHKRVGLCNRNPVHVLKILQETNFVVKWSKNQDHVAARSEMKRSAADKQLGASNTLE